MARWLLRLALRWYPREWRARYGSEFESLLGDLPAPGWTAVWDVSKGAIDMQFHRHGMRVLKGAALVGFAGLILAAGISMTIPDRYTSEALVELSADVEEKQLADTVHKVVPDRLGALAAKHGLFPTEQASEEMFARNIRVSPVRKARSGRRVFAIGFNNGNPKVPQAVVNEMTDAILERYSADGAAGKLSIFDSAPPASAYYPNRPVFAFTGLLAGAAVGAVWAAVSSSKRRPPPFPAD